MAKLNQEHHSSDVRLIAVGTHHKTGTVWLRRTFIEISKEAALERIQIRSRSRSGRKIKTDEKKILVSWNSAFSETLRHRSELRGIHLIRDPRDVLLSGAKYHLDAPVWREPWLYKPDPKLGGLSYNEHLSNLPTLDEQLLFEMENMHARTVEEMISWDYRLQNWMELKYEDLIVDTDLKLIDAVIEFLGFNDKEAVIARNAFWNNSLFGRLAEEGERKGVAAQHVNSGQPAQWLKKMPRSVGEIYASRFGDTLIALGYETGSDWVERLRP